MAQTPQAKYRKDYTQPSHTITDIELTFDLHDTATTVTAVSYVKQLADSDTLCLHGDGLTLEAIKVDGADWDAYEQSADQLEIRNLPVHCELTIITLVNPEANTALEGLYKSGGAFCTQCEAEGFRRITYYLDRPDVLAKFTTTVIADNQAYPYLLSNGNRIEEGVTDNGRHWVKWQDPHPKPSYLFALVAGDFDVRRDQYTTKSGREVTLEIFVDKGNHERSKHAMTSLINSMKWDEERFGLEYDLDIYMVVAVDFFNMGAMENKGLNVFNSKYVLADDQSATDSDYLGIEAVIGHEYFHNWTGNRVTCRDWFQLSLKEGLTVFRDQEFSSDLGSRAVNRINNVCVIRGAQFEQDAGPMSHPIRPEKVIEMNNFYTVTVYEKGSEVIRMMHTLLGETNFQKGMTLYFERHDGTAATCEDFVCAMEDASGIDLSQFRLWYSQSGTPTLTVTSEYDAAAQTYALTVAQHTPATHDQKDKQALHIPFDVELYAADGRVIELQRNGEKIDNVLNVTQDSQTFVFDNVAECPVPSLLREFSAPVKLVYDYRDEELTFLMIHATNEFARWDAGQMLLAKYIRHNVAQVQAGKESELPEHIIDAFRGVLLNDQLDEAFIAEVLTLPSYNEVSGWFDTIDVDAIAKVLHDIKVTLAFALQDELSATYHTLKQETYTIDHAAIGKRSLRNVCLGYLAYTEAGDQLVETQYRHANNMTDTIAAMTAANRAQLPCRAALMQDYSDKWSHDGLVMDKWFAIQGTNPASDALDVIRQTMTSHPAFSLKNPNRTRSLIGAFFRGNPVNFHTTTGEGYQFAGDIIRELNSSNPQLAAGMVDALMQFPRYDKQRQALLKAELEKLVALENLSSDLYEKLTKALEQ